MYASDQFQGHLSPVQLPNDGRDPVLPVTAGPAVSRMCKLAERGQNTLQSILNALI